MECSIDVAPILVKYTGRTVDIPTKRYGNNLVGMLISLGARNE